ncbi:MAG: uncharacterized protein K0S08_338 [Gammaproteobacteria bacterium]|jgi:cation diffusion facilitator CzcD-associated flavoprotein CzcO|nr:uncharacterized protein [Gammaproteobacteria bacterium]
MTYEWAVIGAGPAGIAAVGKLLDQKISAKKILWIDPAFKVGDFGTSWRNVHSNTKAGLFLDFLKDCQAFNYAQVQEKFELGRLNPEETCYLRYMAEPLQWVTDHLKKTVEIRQDKVQGLKISQRGWEIKLTQGTERAAQVILAIGAEPKNLAYPTPLIPMQDAMDHERITQHFSPEDTIAVFGASHSAILIIKSLIEHKAKRIINFYRGPLRYAVYMDNWILFDDTGLKGKTAEWARQNIDGILPSNLERVYSNQANIDLYLPQCQKAIYAVGFERRHLAIEGFEHIEYVQECGIIAPGLFGFGIAFPEAKYNPFNVLEHRVGLWKFMDYLNRMLPVWMKYTL